MRRAIFGRVWILGLWFASGCLAGNLCAEEPTGLDIFKQRVLPLMQAERPSSCAECHLSGVDLKAYIRPTQEETFASLVAAKLIDLQKPEQSKLLEFIQRKPDRPSLVSQRVREQELVAFRSWILAAADDPQLLEALDQAAPIGPQVPVEIIRHARRDRVLNSFLENIWTEVGRCAACHSPDRNQQQVEEHGEQVSWIRLNDPQATLESMLENGLIDPKDPESSLLLTKPTMQVDHGGGIKMVVGDRTYHQFRRFIDDYAAMVHDRYRRVNELPAPAAEVSVVTEIWLKIEGVPSRYDKQLLQVDLYRWMDGEWSPERVATSDRQVFGAGELWQHSLSLTAPRGSEWAKHLSQQQLPPGKYLAKVLIDQKGKLGADLERTLDASDEVAEIEFESQWPSGYGEMTVISFPTESK